MEAENNGATSLREVELVVKAERRSPSGCRFLVSPSAA